MGVATYSAAKAGRRVFVMLVVKVTCGRLPVWACWEVKFWKAARQLAGGRGGRGGCEAGKQVGFVRFRFAGFEWCLAGEEKTWEGVGGGEEGEEEKEVGGGE